MCIRDRLKECISNTVSPMVAMARLIKSQNKDVKTVFIGPCIAKKTEAKRNEVSGDVDYVLTFEELLALLDSRNIKIDECEESDTTVSYTHLDVYKRQELELENLDLRKNQRL